MYIDICTHLLNKECEAKYRNKIRLHFLLNITLLVDISWALHASYYIRVLLDMYSMHIYICKHVYEIYISFFTCLDPPIRVVLNLLEFYSHCA